MSISSFPHRFRCASARTRAVGLFFVTSIGARGVGILCQLCQVPIAMRVLGPEAFGLWMTLVSVNLIIAFADLGIGQGAQNQLAEAFAAGDDARARSLWGSAFVVLGAMGLGLAAAAWVVAPHLDVVALFHLRSPDVTAQAPAAVRAALVLFCLNFPLGLAQRLAYSRQKGWMHNLAQAAGAVFALAGIVWAARHGWQLAGIIAVTQAGPLLANAGLILLQLGQLDWLRNAPVRCERRIVRGLLSLGAYFGVQQVLLTLMIAMPPIAISAYLGAAAVTPYNLAQRLFNLFAIVQNAFMLPLWPAYSDAKARGEFGWIRRTLARSLIATLGITLAPMAIGTCFARPIIAWWVGAKGVLPSPGLVWLLFLWNAAIFLQQPFGYLLAGLSEVKRLTFYAAVSAVASGVLMCIGIQRFAQAGAVLGMLAGYLPFLILGNMAETVRVLRPLPAHS